MKKWMHFVLAFGVVVASACGGSSSEAQGEVDSQIEEEVEQAETDRESSDEAVQGAPRVAETYQRTINRGWKKASEGETPAYACAGLKGRIMGTEKKADPEAVEALFACNVLLPVRYFETQLARVEAGEQSCYDFQRDMSIQLGGMTMSIDSIEGMVEAFADAEDGQAGEDAVTALADATTLKKGMEDPERAIKDKLEETVQRVCPDSARSILR